MWRGFGFLGRRGVRRFVLLPLIINILLFATALWYAADRYALGMQHLEAHLPHWLLWLAWILWLVFALAATLVLFYVFALGANLVSAPFNVFLSARIEELVTGHRPDSGRRWWQDMGVALGDETRRLWYLALRALLIGILGLLLLFVPLLNLAVPVLWFAFTAWSFGLQYSDYPLSNHGVDFKTQRALLGQRRARVLGFGTAAALCNLVPLVNFLAMPAAVAGATLLWLPENPRNRQDRPGS